MHPSSRISDRFWRVHSPATCAPTGLPVSSAKEAEETCCCVGGLLQRRGPLGRNVPENYMVVRIRDSWVAIAVVDIDMINLCLRHG